MSDDPPNAVPSSNPPFETTDLSLATALHAGGAVLCGVEPVAGTSYAVFQFQRDPALSDLLARLGSSVSGIDETALSASRRLLRARAVIAVSDAGQRGGAR